MRYKIYCKAIELYKKEIDEIREKLDKKVLGHYEKGFLEKLWLKTKQQTQKTFLSFKENIYPETINSLYYR